MGSQASLKQKQNAYMCVAKLLRSYHGHLSSAERGCAGLFVSLEDLQRNIGGFDLEMMLFKQNVSLRDLDEEDQNKAIGAVDRITNASSHVELIQAGGYCSIIATHLDNKATYLDSEIFKASS